MKEIKWMFRLILLLLSRGNCQIPEMKFAGLVQRIQKFYFQYVSFKKREIWSVLLRFMPHFRNEAHRSDF